MKYCIICQNSYHPVYGLAGKDEGCPHCVVLTISEAVVADLQCSLKEWPTVLKHDSTTWDPMR